MITALAALIGALKGSESSLAAFVDIFRGSESSTVSTQPTDTIQEPSSNVNNELSTDLKVVGSDVVLINDSGEVDLPEVENTSSVAYLCQQTEDSNFRTVAKTSNVEVILINWTKYVDADWDPASRCKTVTERFQSFDSSGDLDYLTTGRINGENVVCVAASDGDCNRDVEGDGLLFTITSGGNPGKVLLNLMDLALAKDVPPINESAGNRVYINIHQLIKASESKTSSSSESSEEEIKAVPLDSSSDEDTCLFGCGN